MAPFHLGLRRSQPAGFCWPPYVKWPPYVRRGYPRIAAICARVANFLDKP